MRDAEDAARAAGQMIDIPPISQRSMATLEGHAEVVAELEAELDRRADIIINLTRSLEFERRRAKQNGKRRGA